MNLIKKNSIHWYPIFAANTLGEKGGVAKLFFASSGFLDVIRNSEMVNQIVCMMHRHTPALRSLFSRSEI